MAKGLDAYSRKPSVVVGMRNDLARKIAGHAVGEGDTFTAIPGFILNRRSELTAFTSSRYEPSLVVFAQGQKRINLGNTTCICDSSTFLLTSVDLPVVSQVIDATADAPILGMILKLEMPDVRRIMSQEEFSLPEESAGREAWL